MSKKLYGVVLQWVVSSGTSRHLEPPRVEVEDQDENS